MIASERSVPTAVTLLGDSGTLVMQYQEAQQVSNSSGVLVYEMVLGIYTDRKDGRIVGTKTVVNRLR